MFDRYAREVEFARAAMAEAARLARAVQAAGAAEAELKADASPVTLADLAVQALVARRLESAFPRDALVAEEDCGALHGAGGAARLGQVTAWVRRAVGAATAQQVGAWIDRGGGAAGGRYWALDPVDGTRGFVRGGQFACSLGLIEGGEPVIGALACPGLDPALRPNARGPGVIALAVRGAGAWAGPLEAGRLRPLCVSAQARPEAARLLRSYEDRHTDPRRLKRIVAALGVRRPPRRLDSLAKFVLLAGGAADLVLRLPTPQRPERDEWVWDLAAGALLVREAGGMVSDLQGRPLDFRAGRALTHNRGVLASNGALHAAALAAVRAAGPVSPPDASDP